MGERERIGTGPVVGHLTSATLLRSGGVYVAGESPDLYADAEVALRLGRDADGGCDRDSAGAAITGFGAALEIVDLGSPPDDPVTIVTTNVFHRRSPWARWTGSRRRAARKAD
jgi:hypothetical protein